MKTTDVILLVEDSKVDAECYKEAIESAIAVSVIAMCPPTDLADLPTKIKEVDASAVILDQRLQQHSDATYAGIDAKEYLQNAFPGMPVVILTEWPHSPELKGRGLLMEHLVRKRDFDDDEFRRQYLQELYRMIRNYRDKKGEFPRLSTASKTVTRRFVESLAGTHFATDKELEQIVWIRSCGKKRICLIEVSRTALPMESFEVFRFAPSQDMPFPLLIADVRPTEWEKIRSGSIKLPEGWDLQDSMTFQRSEFPLEG